MAVTTCSCTSALSSVPALAPCVKARRSATKSLPIAAPASLPPTICAQLTKYTGNHGGRTSTAVISGYVLTSFHMKKAALCARPFRIRCPLQEFTAAGIYGDDVLVGQSAGLGVDG